MTAVAFGADLDDDGAPVSEYSPGDPLFGDSLAWKRLGVGQRCETWLAWSSALWCPTVVKFPRPHQLDHPRARRSLCREVAALTGNLHPALVRVYEDGTRAAVPYVVFEHVDGIALDDELAEHGAFQQDETGLLALHILGALRTVHAKGFVHVDIKPANIMLRDGRPVLLDFGSARALGAPQPRGKLIGSPGYAAPELEAGRPISAAMDLYGLAVTLHEALTGEPAFDPALLATARPTPPALPPSPLADLIMRMLDIDPGTRPDLRTTLLALGDIAHREGHEVWPTWAWQNAR